MKRYCLVRAIALAVFSTLFFFVLSASPCAAFDLPNLPEPTMHLLFEDTFTVRPGYNFPERGLTTNANGNPDINDEFRFGGTIGRLWEPWKWDSDTNEYWAGGVYKVAIGNLGTSWLNADGYDDQLKLCSTNSTIGLTINSNFNMDYQYRIELDVLPLQGRVEGSSAWAGVLFGHTDPMQPTSLAFDNNGIANEGLGFYIDNNGVWNIYENGLSLDSGIAEIPPSTYNRWYDLAVDYWVYAFDGESEVFADFYLDEELIASVVTGSGFWDNYITLMAHSTSVAEGGCNYSGVDNVRVYAYRDRVFPFIRLGGGGEDVPEPASVCLAGLAMFGTPFLVWGRRKQC